jgi:hypothetical protein
MCHSVAQGTFVIEDLELLVEHLDPTERFLPARHSRQSGQGRQGQQSRGAPCVARRALTPRNEPADTTDTTDREPAGSEAAVPPASLMIPAGKNPASCGGAPPC